MATLSIIRTLALGAMKTILVDPSFVIITINLICLIHASVYTRRGEEIPYKKNFCEDLILALLERLFSSLKLYTANNTSRLDIL